MNSTTSLASTIDLISSWILAMDYPSVEARRDLAKIGAYTLFRRRRLQLQGMQRPAHMGAQRLIDELMLLQLRLAGKFLRDDRRRVMIAVARQIADFDLCIRDRRNDQFLDFGCGHRHQAWSSKIN